MARLRRAAVAWAIVALGLGATTSSAQELVATLEGVVTDSSGAVVPGATVTISGDDATGRPSMTTAADGRYWFPSVPPGHVAVTVELAGFRPVVTALELALGSARRLDVAMTPAGVDQHVAVTARAASIDTLQSGSFRTITGDVARLLPAARDFTSAVTMLPGANDETRLAGISLDGSSGAENRYLNDGADSTDLVTGTTGKGMRMDFLGEVQVKSSGYAAEFGGSTGGVISAVLRAGSDQFHAMGGTYYNGNALLGRTRPTLRRDPISSDRAQYVTFSDDDLGNWAPIVTLGGPIVRGRAWFFGGLEAVRSDTTRTTTLVDGSRGTYASRSRSWLPVGSLDWRPTKRLRLRGTTNLNTSRSDGALPSRAYGDERGTSSPTYPWAEVGTRSFVGASSMQADAIVGAWLFVNARGGYFRDRTRNVGIPDDVKYVFARTNIGLAGVSEELQRPGSFTNINTNDATVRDSRDRLTSSVAGTFYARWLGAHVVKAGGQFEHYRNDVLQGNQNDVINLYWGLAYPASDGRVVRGTFGYYTDVRLLVSGNASGSTVGLFLQDAWRVTDRLTVDLGVRSEREEIPSYDTSLGQDAVALRFGFGQKLAPRVGVAFDPRGDGRSRVYGSAGRYYDSFKMWTPQGAFGGVKEVQTVHTLDAAEWTAIAVNGQYPGRVIESINYYYPFNAPDAAEYGVGVDPDLRPFSQWEGTLGYERQLGAAVVTGVRYVHKAVSRAVEDVGRVVPGVGELFVLGNPGFGTTRTTEPTACDGPCPDQPKAVRTYDAVELTVSKRPGGRWFGDVSYVWSRLFGNYSGLASSDEGGRQAPNGTRVFDALHTSFDAQGHPVLGRLGTDRPHQVKVNAVYQAPFGLSLGSRFVALSGIPEQIEASNLGIPFYPSGRGSLGRYPTFTQTDLLAQQSVHVGRQVLQFEVTVTNLFDQMTPVIRARTPYSQSLNLPYRQFFAGFDLATEATRLKLAANPLFSYDGGYGPGVSGFQARRSARLALRMSF